MPLELLEVTCKKVEYIKVPLELNFAANGMPHPADSVGMHEGVSLLPNVPRYHFTYEVQPADGGEIRICAEITQSEVDDHFAMSSPSSPILVTAWCA